MLKLLKRDLKLMFFSNFNKVVFLLFIPLLFIICKPCEQKWRYFIIVYTYTYTIFTEPFLYDISSPIVNSLPISRKEIVIYKYVSTFVYFLIAIVWTGVYLWIINVLGIADVDYFNLEMIRAVLPMILIVLSILYLVYFDFGSSVASSAYAVMFIVSFNRVMMLGSSGEKSLLGRLILSGDGKYISIMAIILYLLSLFMSMNLYKTKDI
ncbi:MAG: ABC-2 transporter permease [Clostridiaceae bacterium]|nr:ABC-2 transporter permease [Clostridiaceae bacterium]MBW4860930.1 ABC-2 transporter permease [Clostridiaceae bacterium]MBW4867555.1 ABC-2 transporter permease [Clostridiaceae bacterium]